MAITDINLATALFGVLTLGMGYVGLAIKHRLVHSNFKEMKGFDKLIQSLTFGTITFLITLKILVSLPSLTTEEGILSFIVNNPKFFLVQFMLVCFSIPWIIAFEVLLDRISGRD